MGLCASALDEIQGFDMTKMRIIGYEIATIRGIE
jgi:hypothetical protein